MARPDFPRDLQQFVRRFRDEEECFRYLAASRWPEGIRCPACGHGASFERGDRLAVACARCKRFRSATAGTVMHRSRQPSSKWLLAAYLVTTDKRGISALQLQRQLGLSRYETAFQMLHKLRAAMVAPDRSKLQGAVEVDECHLGAPPRNRAPREALRKLIVAGAVEVRAGENKQGKLVSYPGRILLRHIPARTKRELVGFVADTVETGALILVDGLGQYADVEHIGYERGIESTAHGMAQRDVLRHFNLVVSNLKAWLHGTLHGGISGKHLQAYLNEYTLRVNRRRTPQAAFQTVLGIASKVRGPTYDQLYTGAGEPGGWEHPGLLGGGAADAVPF